MSHISTICPSCGQLVPVEGSLDPATGGYVYDTEAALAAHVAAAGHPEGAATAIVGRGLLL